MFLNLVDLNVIACKFQTKRYKFQNVNGFVGDRFILPVENCISDRNNGLFIGTY